MVLWAYPPTRKQLAVTVGLFVMGSSLAVYGAHLSLSNIAYQQARAQARKQYVKDRLRQMLDD